jgi:hypothetical protein
MGVLPFSLSPEVMQKFDDFKQGTCNWIDMTIESEVIQLIGSKMVDSTTSLSQYVTGDNARYDRFDLRHSLLTFIHHFFYIQLYCCKVSEGRWISFEYLRVFLS